MNGIVIGVPVSNYASVKRWIDEYIRVRSGWVVKGNRVSHNGITYIVFKWDDAKSFRGYIFDDVIGSWDMEIMSRVRIREGKEF